MARSDFEEREDRWRLLLEGGEVVAWRCEDGSHLLELSWPPTSGRDVDDRIRVFAAPDVSRVEGTITLGDRVQDIVLWNDGRLSIVLETARLEVEPAPDYEAWEIRGPGLAVAPTSSGEVPSIWVGDGDDGEITAEEFEEALRPFFEQPRGGADDA